MRYETIGGLLELEDSTRHIPQPLVVILRYTPTPIFTTCRAETNLDVVFSSISRSCKVVLCHACRSHSNHMTLPSTASYILLSYILCIYFSMDL